MGGYTPKEVHSMLNRMVPTPHSYLYYTWRNRQNIFCIFFKFLDFFKNHQKSRENKKSSVGGYTPKEVHSMLNRMVPTPHSYLYYTWRNRQNKFKKFSFFFYFFEKTFKKVWKMKHPACWVISRWKPFS